MYERAMSCDVQCPWSDLVRTARSVSHYYIPINMLQMLASLRLRTLDLFSVPMQPIVNIHTAEMWWLLP